jgi:hypothetical protein
VPNAPELLCFDGYGTGKPGRAVREFRGHVRQARDMQSHERGHPGTLSNRSEAVNQPVLCRRNSSSERNQMASPFHHSLDNCHHWLCPHCFFPAGKTLTWKEG